MTTPVKNTGCNNTNIFGGFNQTLFLGCSIMSFSASAGWNEQQSEVTVQLVEDTCAPPAGSPKKYWDTDLTEQDWTSADPGFFGLTTDIIGAPVYFRVGDFEFSGQIQSWEESYSHSGNPTYQVKIVDPRGIIENSQVIINEYAGGVGSIYNLINAFGYMETLGTACAEYYQSSPGVYSAGSGGVDGSVFGSPAGAYGGADVNDNGMQWNQILAAKRILLSSFPVTTNIWSPYGRLAFKAPSSYPASGMGIMPADTGNLAYYYLDLQEVPTAPSYWRLNGVNVAILEAISQVCKDSGHDYYVELIPVVDATLGPGIHKFIKIRTADRFSAPASNSIDTFVGNAGRQVLNYSKGRELRNEITQSFVIGGPKNSFYQAEQSDDPEGDGQPSPVEKDDMIIPYFGLDPTTGNAIIPVQDANGYWEYDAYTDDLALQLASAKYTKVIPATVLINEKELIAAQSGYDAWASYASFNNTPLWAALSINIKAIFNFEHVIKILRDIPVNRNKMRMADVLAMRNGAFSTHVNANMDFEISQIAFAWISKIADEYYGKQFQVRVPFTCGRTDSESDIILLSEQPNDGGWTEVTPVLGLSHPSVFTDFFTLSDNRLGAFCRFDNTDGLELSNLSVNDFVSTSNKAWVKLQVSEEYVYVDKSTLFSPRAIVSLPQPIREVQQLPNLQKVFAGLDAILTTFRSGQPLNDGQALNRISQDILKSIGSVQGHLAMHSKAEMPDACGFGIKSNILTYGPWGAAGAVGGVEVTHDDGLVPWEYNGFTTLDLAGNAKANEGITNQQVAEEGKITVAGYPDLPLGAELLASDAGGPFSGGGNNLIENRSAGSGTASGTTYYFATIFPWDGTYGPNVTGVTVQVGPDGLQTTYDLRTWTPKFGRFIKNNAERLRRVGQQNLKFAKQLRAFTLHRIRRRQQDLLNKGGGANRPGVALKEGKWGEANSPHELLAGQIAEWDSGNLDRPFVTTMPCTEAQVELEEDYDSKAFMSLDGLLRPVSMNNSGGLPRYAVPGSNCQKSSSRGSQPPIDKLGEAGNLSQYNLDIDVDYLNPFSNPSGKARSSAPVNRSDTPSHGNDIEMIARGAIPPASSLVMPMQGYADTTDTAQSDHADDYRMLALRGPLLMTSWGYDLDGFPVPNKVDDPSNARSGVFVDTGLQHKFMDDWLRKSSSWPVGPIDLRWDRARAVWTIPQYRYVVGKLEQDITAFGTGIATQISGPTLYDSAGSIINDPQFVAKDQVGHPCMVSGDNIIAQFDPYSCEYSIIEHKTSGKQDDMFRFYLTECVCIDFQHRAERYAVGMRQRWNATTSSWEDDYEVKLYPGVGGDHVGPAMSGMKGWAKVLSNPSSTGNSYCDPAGSSYIDDLRPSGSGGAQVIWMEEMANFIEFQTTENIGCNTDTCFSSAIRARGALANISDYWNGSRPSGDVFVKWSTAEDISCLRGYNECDVSDTIYPKKGIAVLDKQASSESFCSTGCYDNETCSKWVYNVVEWDKNPTLTDICCTGNVKTGKDHIEFYNIQLGTGLTFTQVNSCDVRIESNIKAADTNCCLSPESGFTRAGSTPASFETINFGAGLWAHKASVSNEDCGITFPDTECENTDCLYHVFAGFKPMNNSGLCFADDGTNPLTSDGTRFINVVDFQGGLRAVNGSDSCDLLLRAGIEVSETSGCILDTAQLPDANRINHKIVFKDGLKVRDSDLDDCQIEIGAGVIFSDSTTCVDGTVGGGLVNKIELGKGLWGDETPNSCNIKLGAGFTIDNNSSCISTTSTSTSPHNELIAGKGINIRHTGDCTAEIGLYMDVDGIGAAELSLGGCLKSTNLGSCNVEIDLKDKYQDYTGTAAVQQTLLSSISATCCDSGGIGSITAETKILHFNACGQLVDITTGSSIELTCPCPSGA